MIAWLIGMSAAIIICSLHYIINERPYEGDPLEPLEPFVVSEYYDRMEKAAIDILENQEPVDQTIILWWGMDGLRMNEDGSLEWISRKKPKPVNQNVSYQPRQAIHPIQTGMLLSDHTQSTRAQIDALMERNANLQMQAAQNVLNAAIISQIRPPYMQSAFASPLQQCCVQYQVQYPSYYYGGCCRLN